jgi:transposase InsO family protein
MNVENPNKERSHRDKALGRFAAIQSIKQSLDNALSMTAALELAARQPWNGRFYSASTIETWWYRFRRGGFDALLEQPRSDQGAHKALEPGALEHLITLRKEHPRLTLKALAAELMRRGVLQPGAFSLSTLHRRLTEAGLDRQSLRAGSGLLGGPTKAFECALPNMLWMTDCMHGPTLSLESGKSQRTYLFAFIDDASRLCPHAEFYPHERLEWFLRCLREALLSRGIPDTLYTDNGPAFRSQHLSYVCANLHIRLLHTKPYHAWSKGKIERFFLTLQKQFLPTLVFEPVQSLKELNRRLWQWIETDYHQRAHSSLQNQSPAQRFARIGEALRTLDPTQDLDRLFLMRVTRRIRKDATFTLQATLWEAPTHLRGQKVTVHYDPTQYQRVELWLGQRFIATAKPCDKNLNATLYSRSNNYGN